MVQQRGGRGRATSSSPIVDLDRAILSQTVPGSVAVLRSQEIRSAIPYPEPIERVPAHVLIFPIHGELRHSVDFTPYNVVPGDALHIFPGQVQRWDFDGLFEALILIVRPQCLPAGAVGSPDHSPVHHLGSSEQFVREVLHFMISISPETQGGSAVLIDLARAVVRLATSRTVEQKQTFVRYATVMNEYRVLIDNHMTDGWRVDDYAKALGVAQKTLGRLTAAAVGLSPKEFLDDRTSMEAKRLIVLTDLSLGAIGRRLGFADASSFTKFFVRTTGITPALFRKRSTR